MVKLEEMTIYKNEISKIIDELLDPCNVDIFQFVQYNIEKIYSNLHRTLISSTKDNDIEIIEVLLKLGADIETKDGRNDNYTPLHWAVSNDLCEMVTLLLEKGANIEATTNDNETALHLCVKKIRNLQLLEILLKRGANVNTRDKNSHTPLHSAAIIGLKDEMKMLIKYGADIKAMSEEGKTAADYARINGHYKIASWLKGMQSNEAQFGNGSEIDANDKIVQFLKRLLEPEKRQVLSFFKEHAGSLEKNINISLLYSALKNVVVLTEILLDRGADITTRDESGYTALHLAVKNDCKEMVKCLLDRGADIEQITDDSEQTAMHIAAKNARMEVLELLLQRGGNVNARDKSNRTPLHEAASEGYLWVAQLLVEHGGDVQAVSEGKTPVDIAKERDYIKLAKWLNWKMETVQTRTEVTVSKKNKIKEFVKYMLEPSKRKILEFLSKNFLFTNDDVLPALEISMMMNDGLGVEIAIKLGADISVRRDGELPLLHRAVVGDNVAVIKVLLDHGVDIEERDFDTKATPLHMAAFEGFKDTLELLLERGANVNSRMEKNKTPLHEATSLEVAKLLVKYGADIEAECDDGMPLHVAASKERPSIVEFLLERGAAVNSRNKMNRTPLHEAAGCGHYKETELLVKHGADIEAESHLGTPADFARSNGHFDLAEWLIEIAKHRTKNDEVLDIMKSEEKFKTELIKTIKEMKEPSNIEIPQFFESHMTSSHVNINKILHECVQSNSIMEVEIVLELGADINATADYGCPPLHWASEYGYTEIAKYLLDHGADIEQTEACCGRTALHRGSSDVLKLLLERGAKVNAKDLSGLTPLHIIAKSGNQNDAELLVKYGADIKANGEGGTPLDLARDYNNDEVADWLDSL